MITFGLTGSIAVGKSTATKAFVDNGIPMVDADIIAREVVQIGKPGYRSIVKTFGKEYLNEDQTINRTKLGALIFSSKDAKKRLEHIMFSLINQKVKQDIASLHKEGHPIVGYDCALIIEAKQKRLYHPLILVWCPLDMQIDRLMKRNGLTRAEAMLRIDSQMSSDEKISHADCIIDSSQSIQHIEEQVSRLIINFKRILTQTI
jgi:dephospho-CoA kinase